MAMLIRSTVRWKTSLAVFWLFLSASESVLGQISSQPSFDFSELSVRPTSVARPPTELSKLVQQLPGSSYTIAHWSLSNDWARTVASSSPFAVEYQASATYASGYQTATRVRNEPPPRKEAELRKHYKKAFPQLRDDQIDRLARLNAQVDAKIKDWRKLIQDLDVPDQIAFEYAAAADDSRMSQLLQEAVFTKATPGEADVLIPKFEAIAQKYIEGLELNK